MRRVFVLVIVLVIVLTLMLAGCSGAGSDAESETSSTAEGVPSPSPTVGAELPALTEGACDVISTAEWERIATEAYEEMGIPLPGEVDFFVGEEPNGECIWLTPNFASLTVAPFDEDSPQSEEGDWCPTRIDEEFRPHEMMPEGVEVADIGVHGWWEFDWRLHVDIAAGRGAWWCFNYLVIQNRPDVQQADAEALGLRIASEIAGLLPDTETESVDG